MRLLAAGLVLLSTYLLVTACPRLAGRRRCLQRARGLAGGVGVSSYTPAPTGLRGRLEGLLENSLYLRKLRADFENLEGYIQWERFRNVALWAALAFPVLAWLLSGEPFLLFASIPASLALPLTLSRLLRSRCRKLRAEKTEVLVSRLSVYLKCGIPLREAIGLCSPELSDISPALPDRFSARLALVSDPSSAVLELAGDLESEELEFISRICEVSLQTGSSLKEVISSVDETIRDRLALRREVESSTVQGKATGLIVSLLPLLFMAMSAAFNRNVFRVLLLSPAGLIMLLLSLTLNLLGFVWIRRILHVEP